MKQKKIYPKIWKGKDNLWYFALFSRNGKQIVRSGDGYVNKQKAEQSLNIFKNCVFAETEFEK